MQRVQIVVAALVAPDGSILLRWRDEQSAVRPNRWSLPGGEIAPGETPVNAADRLIRQQTGVHLDSALDLFWHGFLPGTAAEVYFLFAAISTPRADVTVLDGFLAEFVPGDDVLSGRSFTPASGYILGRFLDSTRYRSLVGRGDASELA